MRDLGLYDESRETIDDCLGTSDDFARDLPLFWLHASGLVAHGSTLDDYGLSADGDRVLDALRLFGPEGVWTGDMDDDNEPETVRDLVPDRTLN